MPTVLVTGVGGGGANNLIRALRPYDPYPTIIGVNSDALALARSRADGDYLIPHSGDEDAYVDALNCVSELNAVDLVIPTNDTEVRVVSERRSDLRSQVLLPSTEAVRVCTDKWEFYVRCREGGVSMARSALVQDLAEIPRLFAELKGEEPGVLWCRMRRGNGAQGALPVSEPEQARSWIQYWISMRGAKVDDFSLSEYLPGRDFAFQSLWRDGDLVIAKTCERLSYLFSRQTPSGSVSTPNRGRLVNIADVNEVALRAIRHVDASPTGVFSVDLKEAADGRICVTEINAGRFFRISPSMNLVGRHNMATMFLAQALEGRRFDLPENEIFGDIGEEPMLYLCDVDEEPSLVPESSIRGHIKEYGSS